MLKITSVSFLMFVCYFFACKGTQEITYPQKTDKDCLDTRNLMVEKTVNTDAVLPVPFYNITFRVSMSQAQDLYESALRQVEAIIAVST